LIRVGPRRPEQSRADADHARATGDYLRAAALLTELLTG
jgi:hypothetical protein